MKTYVYALIIKENRFLILQRPDYKKSCPSFWNLPGGKLKEDESHLDCVKREVFEETELNFHPFIKIFDQIDKIGEDKRIIVFLGFTDHSSIKISEEHIRYMWIRSEKIVSFKVMPYINRLFDGI